MHRSHDPARKPSARRSPGWPGRAEADLNTVNAFAISLLQQTTLDELLWSMVDNIGRLLGYEDCTIYLCEGDRIVQAAAFGAHAPETGEFHQPLVLRSGQGIVGTVPSGGTIRVAAANAEDGGPSVASPSVAVVIEDHGCGIPEEHLEKIFDPYFSAAQASGRPFSAVILDLTIPGGMGGKEVIPKLRDIEPGVKAIVASGYSNDPVMSAHESHGFQAVIEKPFDLAELDQVLSRLIA